MKSHYIIKRFLSRNHTNQKRVEPTIQTTEREKSTAKNNISIKSPFRYNNLIPMRYKREIKTFADKEKLKEFTTRRPPLQAIFKGVILLETKDKRIQNYE